MPTNYVLFQGLSQYWQERSQDDVKTGESVSVLVEAFVSAEGSSSSQVKMLTHRSEFVYCNSNSTVNQPNL